MVVLHQNKFVIFPESGGGGGIIHYNTVACSIMIVYNIPPQSTLGNWDQHAHFPTESKNTIKQDQQTSSIQDKQASLNCLAVT